MAEKITFEESLGVEPEEFTLPLIRGCDDALVVYIPDKSSNIIMIPEKATSIDAYTFDLQDLKEVFEQDYGSNFEYPETVGTDYIEKIVIHKNVDCIENYAFSGLKNLKTIEVDKENPYYRGGDTLFETREYEGDYISFLWCSSEKTGDYEVASWIDSIGPKAFLNSKLDSVTLGEKIDYIWEDAFENCENLVIKAPEGSYAIEFAKENGLKFEEITY
jgi:hypothetical protein